MGASGPAAMALVPRASCSIAGAPSLGLQRPSPTAWCTVVTVRPGCDIPCGGPGVTASRSNPGHITWRIGRRSMVVTMRAGAGRCSLSFPAPVTPGAGCPFWAVPSGLSLLGCPFWAVPSGLSLYPSVVSVFAGHRTRVRRRSAVCPNTCSMSTSDSHGPPPALNPAAGAHVTSTYPNVCLPSAAEQGTVWAYMCSLAGQLPPALNHRQNRPTEPTGRPNELERAGTEPDPTSKRARAAGSTSHDRVEHPPGADPATDP